MRATPARSFAIVALAVAALAVGTAAGCKRESAGSSSADPTTSGTSGSATPSASASSASASPSAPPSPTADPATVFAADGIGPYVIGTALSDLQGRSLVTGVYESPLCDDAKGAEATGRYAGAITLSFRADRLTAVNTNSTTLVTPSGARVGMTLAQLQAVYGSRGTLITGVLSNKAYVVRVLGSGLAIVFYLDTTNTRVAAMSGGEAAALEEAARVGEGC
jgi:hypothetical protein